MLALAVNIFTFIPGSMVLEIDQERRLIYVHVIDVGNDKAVARFYRQVAQIERLLVASFERDADWRPAAQGGRMNTVWIIAAVMLTAAATIVMFRILAGPSTLDRLVALDTLVAVTMCAIGTWAAFSLDTTVTYGLTALALISFVGSVSVARFRVPDIARQTREQVPAMNSRHRHRGAVLGGSTLALTAAIGVVRFPDTLSRMHAATKPQVLGLLLVLIGAAIRLRGNVDVGMLILTGIFTLITAPVVANRVGQLAYREQNTARHAHQGRTTRVRRRRAG